MPGPQNRALGCSSWVSGQHADETRGWRFQARLTHHLISDLEQVAYAEEQKYMMRFFFFSKNVFILKLLFQGHEPFLLNYKIIQLLLTVSST